MKIIRNICLVDTPYALALYLLKMPMEEILHTKFITGCYVDDSITKKLPNQSMRFYITYRDCNWKKLMMVRLKKIFLMPYIYTSSIYAQDHLPFSAQIIGRKKYLLIADGPLYLTNLEATSYCPFDYKEGLNTIKSKIKSFFAYYGTIYGYKHGMNSQCLNRWIVSCEDLDSKYIINKMCEFVDTKALWEQSSDIKKSFILNVFQITSSMLEQCQQKDYILLTQPFQEDCGLTDKEYVDIYEPIINKYENIIIKPHPREKFDFKLHFPNAYVLRTFAPMQLLNYIGVNPKAVITVCSTAISAFPETTKKIVLGTKVHPKILATYGNIGNDLKKN